MLSELKKYMHELKVSRMVRQLQEVTLALDWTPNTNHTGFYIAQAKGWYKDAGIKLKILPYSSTVSPDILVASNKADVGISSTEGVISDTVLSQPVVSIAAIVQHNTSSLVVLEDSTIQRPSDLVGKIYGGFGAPSEAAVVNAIVKKDGGLAAGVKNVVLDTGAMEALKNKRIDVVWIYDGWEGILAKQEGLRLRSFPLIKFGIPDYYTPVIITSIQTAKKKSDLLSKFMQVTARGYEYTRKNPKESAQILIDQVPKGTFPDTKLVFASQEYLSLRYAEKQQKWGLQNKESWTNYPKFLLDEGAIRDASGREVKSIDFEKLFTNEFLK